MIGLQKTVSRRRLNPVQKLRIAGLIGFPCWGQPGHSVMHTANTRDHSLGLAASAVDRNHGGKPCPSQPANKINAERRVFPPTSADARLASSIITAATPPMKSESGFLNTRHDLDSAGTRAASPPGRKKSTEGHPPRSNSDRVAASKPLCNGQGRTIGAVTVGGGWVCFA